MMPLLYVHILECVSKARHLPKVCSKVCILKGNALVISVRLYSNPVADSCIDVTSEQTLILHRQHAA